MKTGERQSDFNMFLNSMSLLFIVSFDANMITGATLT